MKKEAGRLPSATPVAPVAVPFVVVFLLGFEIVLAAQDVEAIDNAEHAVLVDGVMARVSEHEGIDGSAVFLGNYIFLGLYMLQCEKSFVTLQPIKAIEV